MEEEENTQKLNYINEYIIEKGYNPEDLSNYIITKTGIPMEHMNFERLKELIEQFKDQSLQDTYQSIKTKKVTKKDESPIAPLYSTQTYEIKTSTNLKNTLLELEEKKQYITITISDPKLERTGGFFSKSIYSYRVESSIINKKVRRTYNDFEWLREQLFQRYPLRIVTPIIKENMFNQLDLVEKTDTEEMIQSKKAKYLNIFMNKLLQKKIFRTSPIILNFLELDIIGFDKLKDHLSNEKYELNVKFDNLPTWSGKIKCELKEEDIKKADSFNKKYIKLSEIYQKLEKGISNIVSDFKLLENHMKEISAQFVLLNTEINDNPNTNKIKNIFSELNKLFSQWSVSYANQYQYFKSDFKLMFKYLNLETQEMSHIYKSYINYKNEYENFSTLVNKKKEELFESKEYNKWSLAPGTENQLPLFQNIKKIAFEKMLYKETLLITFEKKRVAATVCLLFKQFDKLLKHQGNELEEYFRNLKGKDEFVLGDAVNLIKIFSLLSNEKECEKEKTNIENK